MKQKVSLALAMLVITSGLAFAKEEKPCDTQKQENSMQNAEQQKAKKHNKTKKPEPEQQQERGGFSIYG